MTRLLWDQVGERRFETGVDHGVLYLPDNTGVYDTSQPWNGLTAVTESPSGAESNKQYADNIPYLNLKSAEEFAGTIEAFTYPDLFAQCNGEAEPEPGVYIGQQTRRSFGFSYRTLVGNDTEGVDHGYKLHLVYGADVTPSEKAYGTVNESPEATALSWEFTTSPVGVGTIGGTEYKPTALMVIDSTKVDPAALADLEDALYGTAGSDPRLPLPAEVVSMFSGVLTEVETVTPTYNSSTDVITIPTVTGVVYTIDGEIVTGAQPPITEDTVVEATPAPGYRFTDTSDVDWTINFA
jgi:hypothetical protein